MTRGFTLVEMIVAMLVGVIALTVAFNAIILLTKGEKATDRSASKALTDARLMATLLQDVRSAKQVDTPGTEEYRITRWVQPKNGPIEEKIVTWKVYKDPKNPRITRQVDGETRIEEFNYRGLLDPSTNQNQNSPLPVDPNMPALKLRIQRISDPNVRFPQ